MQLNSKQKGDIAYQHTDYKAMCCWFLFCSFSCLVQPLWSLQTVLIELGSFTSIEVCSHQLADYANFAYNDYRHNFKNSFRFFCSHSHITTSQNCPFCFRCFGIIGIIACLVHMTVISNSPQFSYKNWNFVPQVGFS